jgi:protein ImuB
MDVSRRTISLFLPTWQTDRLRRRLGADAPSVETPLVTAIADGPRRAIAAVDAAAAAVGLAPGQPVARAKVLVPELVVMDAEPERDAAALHKLAEWALRRYSPVVAVDGEDGLRIDATGCVHLFGFDSAMLADLRDRLLDTGIAASPAMAGTHGAAHALARHVRHGSLPVVQSGSERNAVAKFPVASLRLDHRTVTRLAKLGFDTVGQLLSTPRAPLVKRFGTDITRRMDEMLGVQREPFEHLAVPDIPMASLSFVEPIGTPEQLAMVVGRLADTLCAFLEPGDLGVRKLDLVFHRVDANTQVVRVGTAAPSRDPAHFKRMLVQRLDTVDPGLGVEIMTLSAPVTEKLPLKQVATSLVGEKAKPDLASLVDSLSVRLGALNIFRMVPTESEVPERGCERVRALAPPCGTSWPAEWPRPVRMLSPPEPVETMALMPDNPPAQFTWRGIRHRVTRADGPERIFGEWWKRERETDLVRDYFQLEDADGGRFWLYRTGDGLDPATGSLRWYMHGLFG